MGDVGHSDVRKLESPNHGSEADGEEEVGEPIQRVQQHSFIPDADSTPRHDPGLQQVHSRPHRIHQRHGKATYTYTGGGGR